MAELKYRQIFETIKSRILDGTYPVGSLIPDQNSLAEEFKTSRMTVKKSLDMLAKEGFIYSRRGAGTYVRKNALAQRDALPVNEYEGLTHQLGADRVKSKVISFNVTFPDEEIQERLGIKASDPVYEIKRLRLCDDRPYVFEHTFMPIRMVPNLTEDVLRHSVYSFLQKEFGFKIGSAFRRISAEKTMQEDIDYLESEKGDPILQVIQVVYLEDGRPLEFSCNRHPYNGDHAYTVLDRK
jgi:GntR family transcriptional regulator